jgi:prepilin-type N-terminal cleavage/methylation domain-containing protein
MLLVPLGAAAWRKEPRNRWTTDAMTRHGYTLAELIIVVLITAILAYIAVPRLQYAAVRRLEANGIAQQLVTDLRRTRAEAIVHAARNPVGFALIMSGPPDQYDRYQIINLHDSTILVAHDIPATVRCTGGKRFEFGPLGNLKEGSDAELRVSSSGRTFTIRIVATTGAVKWAVR